MSKPSSAPTGAASPRINGPLVVAAIVVLLFLGLLVGRHYFGPDGVMTGREAVRESSPAIGGPFTLTSHTGETVSDADFRGEYMLVYFGYTYCPDICPTSLSRNSDAMAMLGAGADRITPVLITVDPERDTVELLNSYVGHFHPRLVGLTGTDAQVADAAKAYRVYFAKVEEDESAIQDGTYLVDHTSITYLMGPDGQFLQHFNHTTGADTMAERLREILGSPSG